MFLLYRILDILIVRVIGKTEIPCQTKIGKNLGLAHGANGVIISPKVIIGDNVTIYHQVTIGVNNNSSESPQVGDNAKIGANAVVLQDVLDNCRAVGIPARIIHAKIPTH